ncbi:MAG: hydroxymethylbilane synthase [Ruminococcus sp.]|nr:hydroxymethylbilane synthase [Ruminococcus sp.]
MKKSLKNAEVTPMNERKNCIIATRGSRLAKAQAMIVKQAIEQLGVSVVLLEVSTKGDKDQTSPLSVIGGNGLFVKEIEKKLISGEADLAVHSGKDLPFELAGGLMIAVTPRAADCGDCIISMKSLDELETPVIGTGSARRISQCLRHYPNALYENIRGNVDTRIEKLKSGLFDGIILAKAGLDRLNVDLSQFHVRSFEPDEFIPAACQGIIAVECRSDDASMLNLLSKINHEATMKRFSAERYMLSCLQADCSAAVGVHAELDGESIEITAELNGKRAKKGGSFSLYKELCEKIKEEIYG